MISYDGFIGIMTIKKTTVYVGLLALAAIVLAAALGMTRMAHQGQMSFMGCGDEMSSVCFIADAFDHLKAHTDAFQLFSLAVGATFFIVGVILLACIGQFTPAAPPGSYFGFAESALNRIFVPARFAFLSWLVFHFRTIPSL